MIGETQRLLSDMNDNPIDFLQQKVKETLTITIIGDKGSGKTLFMAIIGLIYYLCGIEFYTNFWMPSNIDTRKEFNIRQLYNNPNVEGIFLDEMHNIADQNSNQSVETKLIVALFTQSRKREQLILMSSQKFYKLAKDLRYLTDMLLYPFYDNRRDILYLTFWNLRNDKVYKTEVPKASRFFKYYNTYEIVVSEQIKAQLSSYMLKLKKQDKELEKHLDKNDLNMLDTLEERLRNE